MVARPSPESRQDATVEILAETPETGNTELETVGTAYHMVRDDSSYREGPSTKMELRTKEGEILHYDKT